MQFPDVHPDQVAALGRRRDLLALLDRHVPLGPDQAAVRLGVGRRGSNRTQWQDRKAVCRDGELTFATACPGSCAGR
ncbi:hypothetical protein OG982_30235 [Streptomyces sp. NBC_01551]|uniref:hypothetical protein n=1 Tax=Streptomyces sp. NBC_01551 TaxID=2975876 RepID=UPI00224D21ED|nr:hypothetical protein [Streptomyces sp. NBC_01551]MCX4529920.1 hypothetical protein [Streptomyces sp. NBC_01551]